MGGGGRLRGGSGLSPLFCSEMRWEGLLAIMVSRCGPVRIIADERSCDTIHGSSVLSAWMCKLFISTLALLVGTEWLLAGMFILQQCMCRGSCPGSKREHVGEHLP